jgi:phosphatidylserine synthase
MILRNFKFKDTFTAANLFLSFYAVILVFENKFELASYIMLFNILILDIMDGIVARITKTGNAFGKEFDSVVDFVGSSIIVSFFIYYALKDTNFYLAIVCGFSVMFVGVLRDVRSRLESIKHAGYFVGLPRNIAMVFMLTFFNSILYQKMPFLTVPLIILVDVLQLSHIPFVGNNKDVLFIKAPRTKYYILAGIVFIGLLSCFGLFWNSVFVIMSCYMITPYFIADKAVWDDIAGQVAQRKKAV